MKDEIIRMAREAKLGCALSHDGGEARVWIEGADWHDELERFANLVAEHEREACARVCEQAARGYEERGMDMAYAASEWIEAAIRARGQA